MNAATALIPFVLIRILLFRWIDLKGYQRAQKYAPLKENKKIHFIIYQFCQVLFLLLPFFNHLRLLIWLDYLGVFFYIMGLVIIGLSISAFAQTKADTFSQKGIYRFSRHPMYVGYFFFYLGLGLLMSSYLYLIVLVIFQICTHQIILAEEKECLKTFGASYQDYMQEVRRYF